jgi:hypothetical protein
MASIAHDMQSKLFQAATDVPQYLEEAFHPIVAVHYDKPVSELINSDLLDQQSVSLKYERGRFEVYDMKTKRNLDIYRREDQQTISGIVLDCNKWMEEKGRLACEFDAGSDYGMKPYTTILFNIAYLKYQGQKLGNRNGKYELIGGAEPAPVLDVDSLLSRNAIARIVCYQFLTQTSSLLAENFKKTGRTLPVDEWGWSPPGYDDLNKYYVQKFGEWQKFAKGGCKTDITFTKIGFEAKNPETGEKITFPHDDDLLNEVLKELNYYKEKCDFVNYFQVENYPMFLLSILRLYDVNLELDKATNKYVIAPGPTDQQKFLQIAAEFTFVNNKSDSDYLKKHLTSWQDSAKEPKKPSTTD